MFYRFDKTLQQIESLTLPIERPTAAFLSVDELEALAPQLQLPPHTVRQCRREVRYFRNNMEVGEHYSFATVRRTVESEQGEDCIALYLLHNLFVVVEIRDSDGSTRAGFEAALHRHPAHTVTAERLVAAFFDTLTEGDGKLLEELEYTFSALEETVLREAADDDFAAQLLHHKRELLFLHNYYEQLIDIGKSLADNENKTFAKGELRHFRRFAERTLRLCRTVSSLREQLGQLWEAHRSMLELRQNHIMKTFTVLSAIFLPLSLIVGWYGMNFDGMPELHWRYGYPLAAVLCVTVVLICIHIFKKHHWM